MVEWAILIPLISAGMSITTVGIMAYFAYIAERNIVAKTKEKINGKVADTKKVFHELVNGK